MVPRDWYIKGAKYISTLCLLNMFCNIVTIDRALLLLLTLVIYFGKYLHIFCYFPPAKSCLNVRPETVESLFIAYRLTGDVKYREYGWNIFQAIEKHCKIESGGYASVMNVDELPVEHEDKMETFMMVCACFCNKKTALITHPIQSETLKYLFLLFSDKDIVPLSGPFVCCKILPFLMFSPHRLCLQY